MITFIRGVIRRWIASIFVSQGLTLFDKGQLEYAKAEFQRALRIAPDHPQAHYNLGRIYSRQGRNSEAAAALTAAISFKPKFPAAFALRGLNRLDSGDIEGAIADCERAVALKRSYEHLIDLGSVYTAAKRFDNAQKALQDAVALRPKEGGAHCRLGDCRLQQGQYEEALRILSKAAELEPNNASVFATLARAHEKLGDHREALKNYTRAGFLDRKNAEYRCDAARISEAQGDSAGAIISYQEALRIDPECAAALLRLSREARQDGDMEKARGYAERLARAHPERWEGLYEVALALARLGDEKSALESLKEAVLRDRDAVAAAVDESHFSGLKSAYKFRNMLTE